MKPLSSELLEYLFFCSFVLNTLASWAPVNLPSSAQGITKYVSSLWISPYRCVVAGNKGNLVDGSIILVSNNKGLSWTKCNITSGSFGTITSMTSQKINGVSYLLSVGFQVSDSIGRVFLSTSNGSTWSLTSTTYTTNSVSVSLPVLNSVCIGTNGYAFTIGKASATSFGIFYSSLSSSFSVWSLATYWNDTNYVAFGIGTNDGVSIVAVGSYNNATTYLSTGVVFLSQNTGSSWSIYFVSATSALFSVAALSSTTFFIGGDSGYLAKSIDSGSTWVSLSYSNQNYGFYSISILSSSVVYAAGHIDSSSPQGLILKSVNSGTSWSIEVSGLKSLQSVAMHDSSNGIAGDSSVYATVQGNCINL